jgi:hypothetical protein
LLQTVFLMSVQAADCHLLLGAQTVQAPQAAGWLALLSSGA